MAQLNAAWDQGFFAGAQKLWLEPELCHWVAVELELKKPGVYLVPAATSFKV